jgi:tripartite-type tricarboxylate transporter receptor subunit TctC
MMTITRFIRVCAPAWLALGMVATPVLGWAQTAWPQRPIRVLIPFPPGGPTDIVMRAAADGMQATLKQPVIIDNKPGAGGNIGASEVARATPDGYTWLFSTDTVMTVNPHVYKSLGFRIDDLRPAMIVTQFSQTLVCNPSLGVKTLGELIAKARRDKLSYASGGAGVPGHLSMELLLNMASVDMAHVPYKGPAPATVDVVAGQVPCGLLAGPTVLPHVRAGRLVALAVSGKARAPNLPDTPTISEAGVAGYEADFALVLQAPRATPDEIIQRMREAMLQALNVPEVKTRLAASDQVIVGSTPAEAAAVMASDSRKWGEVARRIKLGLD